jgi:DMSO reductase anchor subunit
MTHITREARSQTGARRAEIRDNLMNGLFTPYTFLCTLLLLGGLSVTLFDAKGLPLLIAAAVLVAIIRLLYTIRTDLRAANALQQENNRLLRMSIQRGNIGVSTGDEDA